MFIFLLSVYVLVSVLLILIVLLQVGHGAEMGAAFGSATQGQVPYTAENFLGKLTTYVAILFMILSVVLVYVGVKGNSASVLDSLPSETISPNAVESPAVEESITVPKSQDTAVPADSNNTSQ